MKHLQKLLDLSSDEIGWLLDLADQLKYQQKYGIPHPLLQGKTLGMIFAKASTRTRVSFEVGMYQLGGTALFLSAKDMQMWGGEPVEDTARVLSRYLDGIMIRTFDQKEVEQLAQCGTVPVINGLTDFCHPCQVLADLMTIREYKKQLEGLTLCYVGDGNNMANSLIVGGLKTGMTVKAACPQGREPDAQVLAFAQGQAFTLTQDPLEAAAGADVIITDVWGQVPGGEAARAALFQGYQVNEQLLAAANPGCVVQHRLPARRGEEITDQVFEAHAAQIFDEAENRLHAQKAVMAALMGGTMASWNFRNAFLNA